VRSEESLEPKSLDVLAGELETDAAPVCVSEAELEAPEACAALTATIPGKHDNPARSAM
jgi:hypothetical protein